jgi:hypothetical protein
MCYPLKRVDGFNKIAEIQLKLFSEQGVVSRRKTLEVQSPDEIQIC